MTISPKVIHILEEMNRLGASGTPFLFSIDYALEEGFIIVHPEEQREVYYSIDGYTNGLPPMDESEPLPLSSEQLLYKFPISLDEYNARFQRIETALLRGDSFLANLTVATRIETPFSLAQIYSRACATYKLYKPGHFVCFSPERFVTISEGGRRIETCPMKGTIDASIPNAEQKILNDYKETAEHYTIVDLMRNDLARVGYNVRVEEFRYIDHVRTLKGALLQVSSRVVADLPEGSLAHLGDIFRSLLPAGSICGAPKEATLRAIAEAEGESRGYYTGVCGYFDGHSLESGVLIRFIEQHADGTLYYRSGGGITVNSSVAEEYNEVIEKVYLPFL